MKVGTKKSISNTINQEQFKIKKKFGQNFLVDQNILNNIVGASSVNKETLVIEIGPGLGSLTEVLLDHSKHVLAYEIDSDLIPILNDTFKDKPLTVIHDDFLKRNIDEDIQQLNMEFSQVIVVANLPYYITTPIIFKVLEESQSIKQLVIMMQLEVARRITSKPKTKDYNSLSIAIQYKTKASIALHVPKHVFIPAPNVDSAVVVLDVFDKIEQKPNNEVFFFQLLRAAFTQRRKTLVNNIHAFYGIDKQEIISLLEEVGYRTDIRSEHLTKEDFIVLSDHLEKIIK